jgi:hypothetical protein
MTKDLEESLDRIEGIDTDLGDASLLKDTLSDLFTLIAAAPPMDDDDDEHGDEGGAPGMSVAFEEMPPLVAGEGEDEDDEGALPMEAAPADMACQVRVPLVSGYTQPLNYHELRCDRRLVTMRASCAAIDLTCVPGQTFEGHTGPVYSVAINPRDPTMILTGGGDDRGFLWAATTLPRPGQGFRSLCCPGLVE